MRDMRSLVAAVALGPVVVVVLVAADVVEAAVAVVVVAADVVGVVVVDAAAVAVRLQGAEASVIVAGTSRVAVASDRSEALHPEKFELEAAAAAAVVQRVAGPNLAGSLHSEDLLEQDSVVARAVDMADSDIGERQIAQMFGMQGAWVARPFPLKLLAVAVAVAVGAVADPCYWAVEGLAFAVDTWEIAGAGRTGATC